MAKTVSTQKGLELELQRRINLALNGGAKTAVENCLKKHIQEDVLDVYQPKVYERRGQGEGALEADSSVVSSVREHVLTVKDIGVPNESAVGGQYKTGTNTPLAEMVEKGDVKTFGGRHLMRPICTRARLWQTRQEKSQMGTAPYMERL